MTSIAANNPSLQSWVNVEPNSDFPIQNLPFGIISDANDPTPRVAVAIGDYALDLRAAAETSLLDELDIDRDVYDNATLNPLMGYKKMGIRALRNRLSQLLVNQNSALYQAQIKPCLKPLTDCQLHLPVSIRDITDFYSSEHHAQRVGELFRDPDNALLPNWKRMPIGYDGRASAVNVSGTDIQRPLGQIKLPDDEQPKLEPTRKLDYELELAYITFDIEPKGQPVATQDAAEHIFGFCLYNDWSARDIQSWEYQPLGPFLSKSFNSTLSPWVVTLDALEPFRVSGETQNPEVLDYLKTPFHDHLAIDLTVTHTTPAGIDTTLTQTNYSTMYWSMSQQLAHHTINNCRFNTASVLASGTISGPTPGSEGCLLEKTRNGANPVTLNDGSTRTFLEDGDTITLSGRAHKEGYPVSLGFGEATGKVMQANRTKR